MVDFIIFYEQKIFNEPKLFGKRQIDFLCTYLVNVLSVCFFVFEEIDFNYDCI